jgi:hypothetical protein
MISAGTMNACGPEQVAPGAGEKSASGSGGAGHLRGEKRERVETNKIERDTDRNREIERGTD